MFVSFTKFASLTVGVPFVSFHIIYISKCPVIAVYQSPTKLSNFVNYKGQRKFPKFMHFSHQTSRPRQIFDLVVHVLPNGVSRQMANRWALHIFTRGYRFYLLGIGGGWNVRIRP